MSSIQGSSSFLPIDPTRLQGAPATGAGKTAEFVQLPKNAGSQSKNPLANTAQLVASPNKAVSETAANMEQIVKEVKEPKKRSLGRAIGSTLVKMQKTIGSATPKSDAALVKAGRAVATLGGAILYGAGAVAGGAVTLTLSAAAGLVGIGLSIVPTILLTIYHAFNPERSLKAFLNDSKIGINLAFQASGALRGVIRDTLFPIAQCIPLGIAALGAGLLEFGLGKNVDPYVLSKGMTIANRDLATYIQKYFPETGSHGSKKGSVADEESDSSEATSGSSRSESISKFSETDGSQSSRSRSESDLSDIPETDTRGRSSSGFSTSSDE